MIKLRKNMNMEQLFSEYAENKKRLEQFNPEPAYVKECLIEILKTSQLIINKIILDSEKSFGLFLENHTIKEFKAKSITKEDRQALEFIDWFETRLNEENQFKSIRFINSMIDSMSIRCDILFPQVMITPNEFYDKDPFFPILLKISSGRFEERDELKRLVQVYSPIYLAILNEKRKQMNQPLVGINQIVASAFYEFEGDFIEIVKAVGIYLDVLKRICDEYTIKIIEIRGY